MKIEPFKMERMQSLWEFRVDYNLSESGVHPVPLRELVAGEELRELMELELGYIQTNGTQRLRETIAGLYPGSTPDQILVTTGSAEANFLLMWSMTEPGDEAIFMMPNYMQIWGLLRGFGATVKPLFLRESLGWAPDLDELKRLVTAKTKMIIVTNPNNPTGSVLSPEAMKTIIELASEAGAWIVSDEVYQGAELDGNTTQTFYGKYAKTIVTNGLSKAYGLPGLRIGWMVGPEEIIMRTWPYHDYTTICLTSLSDRLARAALTPHSREKILRRTRRILNHNFPLLEAWFHKLKDYLAYIPPKAGAITFFRYKLKMNSTQLVDKLIHEKSVLIVPGDHFELDHHLRIGYGNEPEQLLSALGRIEEVFLEVKKQEG